MEKKCTRCGLTKPLEEFCKTKQIKSGYTAHCKKCAYREKRESDRRVKERDPSDWLDRRRGYVKKYKEANPEKVSEMDWSYRVKSKFGISAGQYYTMLESQGGVCIGCNASPNGRKLAVDHDHSCCPGQKTCGKCIRGLLCSNCNTAIGLLKENAETIQRLANYLEDYK